MLCNFGHTFDSNLNSPFPHVWFWNHAHDFSSNNIHAKMLVHSLVESTSIIMLLIPNCTESLNFFSVKGWNWVEKVEIELIVSLRWVKGVSEELLTTPLCHYFWLGWRMCKQTWITSHETWFQHYSHSILTHPPTKKPEETTVE